jgi:hypothetical protein
MGDVLYCEDWLAAKKNKISRRLCKNCGEPFTAHLRNGKKDQRHCSVACALEAKIESKLPCDVEHD